MALTSLACKPLQPAPLLTEQLSETLLHVTQNSTHSYESALHQLLMDVNQLHGRGTLCTTEQQTILGSAVDVLFYFNYSIEALVAEENIWYRASVIHQMAYAMLQTMALLRPDLTAMDFYHEAQGMLCYDPPSAARTTTLHCHHWPTVAALNLYDS